ncbi:MULTISPECIES: gluconokinase [Glycomyces]|uniref:Gluconokinase n=1 Tax=Glycomyces artemisiae TaxID=1076443 RepID=A0A2T0UX02_9ACTN|nr:gluconokinase [Glycomyces artemisiae]PRY62461.1 gluconate kinase (SKI family) [Glycomyces artemisiae]
MSATCLVVMGVSGSGKSTVAELLADRLGWPFTEGDELHPAANIAKMSAGIPLTDADREPWLRIIRDRISAAASQGRSTVVTCSALRRAYRDILREADARVRFVHLDGSRELIGERLAHRGGHFMPPSLLDSQFAALEPLGPGEDGLVVNVADTPADIADQVLAFLEH